MKRIHFMAMAVCLSAGGCAPYTAAQMDLVDQARRGVALAMESNAAQREQLEALHSLRRTRLDEAFDTDVMERGELTGDWIIEHRRAYAAGLDGLHRQHRASSERLDVAMDNLAAVDAALARLRWLQEIQMRWSISWKERKHGFSFNER